MDDIIELFSKHSSSIDDKLEALHDWIEEVHNELKQDGQSRKTSVLFRFTCVLRELVLSHRWQDVIHVISQIVMEASGAQDIIHHLGFEVFLQEPTLNFGLLKKLTDHMKLLSKYDTRQIMLDFFMYLLSEQHFENVVTAKDSTKPGPKTKYGVSDSYLKATYRAYEGLLYYIKWCQVKSKLEYSESEQTSSDTDHPFSHQTDDKSELADKEQLRQTKERACRCFEVCAETPGVWDVFITKWVEILEYHNEVDAARKVLEDYFKKQPGNTYVLSQLYEFYNRNGDREENESTVLDVLKTLCEKVPFGECVLKLYKLCKHNCQEGPLRVRLLFTLLDYPQWKDNTEVWQLLTQELRQIEQRHSEKDNMRSVLSELWTMRSTWWLPYHFRFNPSEDSGLQCVKAVAAVHLYGKDADYVKQTLQNDNIDSEQQEVLLRAITSSDT